MVSFMRTLPVLILFASVGACTTASPPPVAPPTPIRSAPMRPVGLERVLGQDARGLTALFGTADQIVREEGAVRMQFRSPICVLDAYLYTSATNKIPTVTYVDTRQMDGRDIDRASCVAALVRRKEAR
jgi:hypothetical protein